MKTRRGPIRTERKAIGVNPGHNQAEQRNGCNPYKKPKRPAPELPPEAFRLFFHKSRHGGWFAQFAVRLGYKASGPVNFRSCAAGSHQFGEYLLLLFQIRCNLLRCRGAGLRHFGKIILRGEAEGEDQNPDCGETGPGLRMRPEQGGKEGTVSSFGFRVLS